MSEMRIGHGYDVHRFAEGRALIVGGVEVPWDMGLEGHSDADVLTHAVIDAILGAAGQGDIGRLFPDSDPALEGICSLTLLGRVEEVIQGLGYSISNIDSTIIAQKPRMAPFIDEMKENLSRVLRIEKNRVNIKATTEEGLGFTGAMQGISAHSVVLLEKTG